MIFTAENVQVGNEQEMTQSDCNSYSKDRGGKKTKLTIGYLYEGCSLILVIDLFSPKPAFVPEER